MEINSTTWKKISEGDEVAYEVMYKHYYKRFYAYGSKITSNISIVEDAIQEVMIYIWQNRNKLREIKNPPGYIFTFFRNEMYRRLKEIYTEEYTLEHEGTEIFTPEYSLINKESDLLREEQISNAISKLTKRQQEAIHLRFFSELSYQEIAVIMNISVKAMYKLMARSLSVLKNNYQNTLLVISMLLFIK